MTTREKAATGRPRLFDEEAVLATLTALFWKQGYGQTSMSDIVESSGVHKPSLYRTFGSKEQLFALVLRRYLTERMAMFDALIDRAGPGVEGVHTFLELFERDALSARGRDGCLMVMASNELRGSIADFDFAKAYRTEMRARISRLIARTVPAGGENAELADARTDLFTTYLLGLHVIMRSDADADEIHRYLNAMHATAEQW
ncbi:TetR/AcrR family transcriptional regulator [Demequina sediminicola]|uniref:TetR/AcrR family transcriptional regulator n=1 Tax=Demequina sediminicola TaxID=1095026 RepID=UPI000783DFB2|nr:TetR/AcrR family transcriptional regulator [Demequina sediminicola]